MNTETAPPFPWNPQGEKARIVDPHIRTNEITITTLSAHVKVHNINPTVRIIVFESPHMTRVADEMERWISEELELAFKGVESNSANDADFARSRGAKVGVRGKFIRNDDRLILFCHSENLNRTFEISILLDEDIKRRMLTFL